MIVKTRGNLTLEDTSFVTDEKAIEYLNLIKPKDHKKCFLDTLYPDIDPNMLALLKGMLEFNPHLRLTAKEALKSKLFDKIREPYYERPCKTKVCVSIYNEGYFDYVEDLKGKLDLCELQSMVQ